MQNWKRFRDLWVDDGAMWGVYLTSTKGRLSWIVGVDPKCNRCTVIYLQVKSNLLLDINEPFVCYYSLYKSISRVSSILTSWIWVIFLPGRYSDQRQIYFEQGESFLTFMHTLKQARQNSCLGPLILAITCMWGGKAWSCCEDWYYKPYTLIAAEIYCLLLELSSIDGMVTPLELCASLKGQTWNKSLIKAMKLSGGNTSSRRGYMGKGGKRRTYVDQWLMNAVSRLACSWSQTYKR